MFFRQWPATSETKKNTPSCIIFLMRRLFVMCIGHILQLKASTAFKTNLVCQTGVSTHKNTALTDNRHTEFQNAHTASL